MTRDTVKTILGLVAILLIVGATFLYGNAQHQAQLRHDNDAKKQQVADAGTPTPHATPTPVPTLKPTATPTSVITPMPAGIPDTGAHFGWMVGLAAIMLAVIYWIRSRRWVVAAVRVRSRD